jgi:hypothetical protein
MPEFKDLPPLSPERLVELVSASPDDDARFVRHWFTGEYQDPALDATYRIFRLRLFAPRVRFLLGTIALYGLVAMHVSNWKEVVSSSNRLVSVPMDARIRSHNL